jgi:hypothetical protein
VFVDELVRVLVMCSSLEIGLCFVRCADGAVIDSGLHPVAKEWLEAAEVQCNRDGHFRGVGINKMDVIEAIAENAANHSVKMVYLATDGWLRGPKAIGLVTEVFVANNIKQKNNISSKFFFFLLRPLSILITSLHIICLATQK